mmetsp:Transcript_31519/g.97479  ORF Transcript_31519/g.97479 Transcript_31519/m.97479 type:complete len:110 (+) Transcript_31519:183-512(+)
MRGSQRLPGHWQHLIAKKRLCFREAPDIHERGAKIAAGPDNAVCRATHGHPSGEDLAFEDERFVVAPKILEAARKISLSVEDDYFGVRPILSGQSKFGLEHRKRFFGST